MNLSRLVPVAAFSACLALMPAMAEEVPEPDALDLAAHRALQHAIETSAQPLSAFTTDGCSGGLSGAWQVVAERFPDFEAIHGDDPPWEACCVTHDRAYHAGGRAHDPIEDFRSRATADRALRDCVVATGSERSAGLAVEYETTVEEVARAYAAIGQAMYLAVRFGGGPCSGLPWRWGYGSVQCFIAPEDFLTSDTD